jgi:hypothetical protein
MEPKVDVPLTNPTGTFSAASASTINPMYVLFFPKFPCSSFHGHGDVSAVLNTALMSPLAKNNVLNARFTTVEDLAGSLERPFGEGFG